MFENNDNLLYCCFSTGTTGCIPGYIYNITLQDGISLPDQRYQSQTTCTTSQEYSSGWAQIGNRICVVLFFATGLLSPHTVIKLFAENSEISEKFEGLMQLILFLITD